MRSNIDDRHNDSVTTEQSRTILLDSTEHARDELYDVLANERRRRVIVNDDQEIHAGPTHQICHEAIQRCEYAFTKYDPRTNSEEAPDGVLDRVASFLGVA